MVAHTIKQDFWIQGQLIVVENVPAGVCPQGGEKIVKAETGQQLAATLAKPVALQITRTINVLVVSLKAAACAIRKIEQRASRLRRSDV